MNKIIRALDPSHADLADHAWRTGSRTREEVDRSLAFELSALDERRLDGTRVPTEGMWDRLDKPVPVMPRDPSVAGGTVISFC